uniref:Putative lysophospholipid acyltransferase LPEAT1 isoform X5 n=1 Tax=Davidia involucrata TaxID=16924 RepID=A0A5B7BQF0_DAVIN
MESESELKDLNPESSPQPPHETMESEGSTKDDRPLLKHDSKNPTSQPVSAENLEELEKKFAAFVRDDVYGTMGLGELPWTEKVLLAVAFGTLVPIRVAAAITLLVFYYLICRVCTLFSAPNREGEQEDYAHMGGWKRAVIVQSGRFLSRVMLFVLGFYSIEETYRNPELDEKRNTEVPSFAPMVNY